MPTDVVMPQMGESITEGTLTKWLKKPGDAVERDEPLFEISTDKVDAEIPSPAAGIMGEIKTPEGSTVQINTVVCIINEVGSASAPASQPDLKADSATPAAEATAAQESAIPAPEPESEAAAGTEVMMPQMGESITEGHHHQVAQKHWRYRCSRRADLRDLDRQGGRGDSFAGRGYPDRD